MSPHLRIQEIEHACALLARIMAQNPALTYDEEDAIIECVQRLDDLADKLAAEPEEDQ